MVFMSSSVLSWRPVLEAWLQKLPQEQADALRPCFNDCYQVRTVRVPSCSCRNLPVRVVPQELLDFVSTCVSPPMQVLECMYVRQTADLLQVRHQRRYQHQPVHHQSGLSVPHGAFRVCCPRRRRRRVAMETWVVCLCSQSCGRWERCWSRTTG